MRLQTDIWKFPAEGSPGENMRGGTRVTHQTGQVLTPTVGPDGKEVAYLSDSGRHANLWVINTEDSDLRQITHERDPNRGRRRSVWSPDGRSIAFVYSRGNPGFTFRSGWSAPTGATCGTSQTPASALRGRPMDAGCITPRAAAQRMS
jgi:Tol biopolymer transport system component